ncbi:glyoxalase/bleomycin resistance/dioxygenase family protein [Paenibacillus sp. MMS18-CY102]|nr:glyoxalase/bleomycin resistance/dioxygenase family protein [Paenibacillus sp. MMS18-CY102]
MGAGRPGLTLDNHCFEDDYRFIPSNQPLLNLSAADIHEAYRHVVGLGAEIVTAIQVYPDLAEFTFKDPDGNILMACTCIS